MVHNELDRIQADFHRLLSQATPLARPGPPAELSGPTSLVTARTGAASRSSSCQGQGLAATLVVSLPIVVIFLFVQRNLISGLTTGGIK